MASKEKLITHLRRILLLIAPLAALTPLSLQTEFVAYLQTESTERLEAPTLTATSTGSNSVEVSWTEVAGAHRYDFRVWSSSATGWEPIEESSYSGRSYTGHELAPGKPDHYYIVAAVDSDGVIGEWSNQVRVTAPDKLPAPILTATVTGATSIELSWTEFTDAAGYELFTWWASDPGWQLIDDELEDATYSHGGLTPGRKYYYTVRAFGSNGLRGEWSNIPHATVPESQEPIPTPTPTPTLTPTPTPTSTPTPASPLTPTPTATTTPTVTGPLSAPGLTATYPDSTTVELSWTEVSGAHQYDLRVWKDNNTGWEPIDKSRYVGRTYTDNQVSASRPDYYYTVAAVDANGVIGEWSEQVRVVPPGRLPAPTLTVTEPVTTTIELSWTHDSRAVSYELTTWWAPLPNWQSVDDNLRGTSYAHDGLTPGRTYYYSIRAVDSNGVGGEWSAFPSATVPTTAQQAEAAQRAALVALYVATDGTNWTHDNNWLTNEPISDWYGITVDSHGKVSELVLTGNRLRGSLPNLNSLEGLTILSLGSNFLSGSIPELSALTSLTVLDLSFNQLTGSIPQLGALTSLERLSIDNNQLSGPLPTMSALTKLRSLSLGANQFSGSIPDLSKLTNLRELYLTGASLTGSIPDLSALTELTHLYLGNNKLTGSFPDIAALSNLAWVDLSHNMLAGQVPDLSSLVNLTWLSLSRNQFSGQIPDLSALTKLRVLQLGHNRLTGPIPDLSPLTNLTVLDLAGNELCLPAGSTQSDTSTVVAAHLADLNLPVCSNALVPSEIAFSVLGTVSDGETQTAH